MSINHFYPDFPETLWWTQQQQSLVEQSSRPISNTNTQFPNHNKNLFIPQIYHHQDGVLVDTEPSDFLEREEESSLLERQSMFEKHLTPSDVGKLNRLVIPKQHAEKYFPLNNSVCDSGGGEKGFLLSFEDESGKCWRFRYSYWNSSQSYVLTKGWSRYVKEKQLDAGDVVLFDRHRVVLDRFFIGWRRRAALAQDSGPSGGGGGGEGGGNSSNNSSGGEWTRVFYSAHPYPSQPFPYQHDCLHAGSMGKTKTTPVVNSKTLRLFGVNLECQLDDQSSEPASPEDSSMSNQGHAHHLYYPESHNHMVPHTF